MNAKHGHKLGRTSKVAVGDSYDLAVTLRQRLADAARPPSTSVASQLQSAARERLGSDRGLGGRARFRLRSHRRSDPA